MTVNAQTITIDGSKADWADVPMITEPGASPILKMIVPQAGATLPDGAAYCLMVEGNHEKIVAGYPVIYTDADKNASTGTAPWFCSRLGTDYEMATWSEGSLYAANAAGTIREMCISTDAFDSLPFPFLGSFYAWLTFNWGDLYVPSNASENGWKWSETSYYPLNVAPYSYVDINRTHQAAAALSTHAALAPGASLNMKNAGSSCDTLLWASWAVELTAPGLYSVSANVQSTNTASVDLCLVNPANNEVVASFRSSDKWAPSGETVFGDFNLTNVPAGKYVMKFTNHVAYSEMVLSSITLTKKNYTVAGSSTVVFGTSWEPSNAANDMVYDGSDGLFHFTKNNVELPVGNITFKVVKNHSWDAGSYPTNDYVLAITTAGIHNITITFNESTSTVNANDELVQAEVILPTVKVAGGFVDDGWGANAVVLTPALDNLTASGAVTILNAGSFELKVVVGDDWKTISDINNWITRVNNAGWIFSVSGGTGNDTKIDMDMAGEYSFTYTYATGALTVSYPQTYTRHFDHAYYSTICLPQAAVLTNAEAYTITSVAGHQITLSAPVNGLVAGTPYIIKPDADDVDVIATMSGEPTANTVAGANGLWGVLNIGGVDSVSNGNYILSENQFHLVQLTQGSGKVSVPRFRGGLWSDVVLAPSLRIIEAENGATNIQNVEGNEAAVKFVENGKVLILREGVVYDMTGRVVR